MSRDGGCAIGRSLLHGVHALALLVQVVHQMHVDGKFVNMCVRLVSQFGGRRTERTAKNAAS